MVKEERVRKIEALKLVGIARLLIDNVEKHVEENAIPEAEAETLMLRDVVKLLLVTIRRLERL